MTSKWARKHSLTQIQQMRQMRAEGFPITQICSKFHCHINTVQHHTFDVDPPRKHSPRNHIQCRALTDSQVVALCNAACYSRVPSVELGRKYRIAQSTALGIVKGKTYRHVRRPTLPHIGSGRHSLLTEADIVMLEPVDIPQIKSALAKKSGPRVGSCMTVVSGTLKLLAAKYSVSNCSIYRRIRNGKITQSEVECAEKEVQRLRNRRLNASKKEHLVETLKRYMNRQASR